MSLTSRLRNSMSDPNLIFKDTSERAGYPSIDTLCTPFLRLLEYPKDTPLASQFLNKPSKYPERPLNPQLMADDPSEVSSIDTDIKEQTAKVKEYFLQEATKKLDPVEVDIQYTKYKDRLNQKAKATKKKKKGKKKTKGSKNRSPLSKRPKTIKEENEEDIDTARKNQQEEEIKLKETIEYGGLNLPDNDKVNNCNISPNLLSLDDLKDKNVTSFKENLSKNDIKMLRNRQFVIKEDPNSSQRLVNIEVKPESTIESQSRPGSVSQPHSQKGIPNQVNPHIHHLPVQPRVDVFRMIREEGSILNEIRRKNAMEKYEHIYLDRDFLHQTSKARNGKNSNQKITHRRRLTEYERSLNKSVYASQIRKSIRRDPFAKTSHSMTKNSRKNDLFGKIDDYLKSNQGIDQSDAFSKNLERAPLIDKHILDDYLGEDSMMRLGSFRPESAASKYLNYETTLVLNKMPEFSKNRVKTYARLMSAKPELIHGAREFRKYVNQPTLNQTTSGIDKSMLNKSLLDSQEVRIKGGYVNQVIASSDANASRLSTHQNSTKILRKKRRRIMTTKPNFTNMSIRRADLLKF